MKRISRSQGGCASAYANPCPCHAMMRHQWGESPSAIVLVAAAAVVGVPVGGEGDYSVFSDLNDP